MKAIIFLFVGLVLTLGCSNDSKDNGPTGTVNHAPVIQSINASPQEVARNRSASLVCVATDADRDTLTYAWSTRFGSVSANGAEADWQAPAEAGTYWVKVIVNDGVALDVDSVQVTVAPNRPPVIESLSSSSPDVGHGGTITITCAASDPDNDVLRYTWTPSAGSIQGSSASVSWHAPQTAGMYWIKLEVSDGTGSAFDSVLATVTENRPPTIRSIIASPTQVIHGQYSTIVSAAVDDDGDAISYTWTSQSGTIQGSNASVQWRSPMPAGTYSIHLLVSDGIDAVEDSVSVSVLNNRPPTIRSLLANPENVIHDGSSTITCTASDDDSDNLSYSWIASQGLIQGTGASVQWHGPQNQGTFWIKVGVSDNFGITPDSVQITILPNRLPVIQSLVANPSELEHGETTSLSCTAADADGDALTYSWNAASGRITGNGQNVSWTAPIASGSFWISVGVHDGVSSVRDTAIVTVVPPNSPPATPFDPRPGDYARDVIPDYVEFSWRSVDADGDLITYDFYFGNSYGGSLIQRDLNDTIFPMNGLNANTEYYWGVVARDNRGGVSQRTIWSFRTQ